MWMLNWNHIIIISHEIYILRDVFFQIPCKTSTTTHFGVTQELYYYLFFPYYFLVWLHSQPSICAHTLFHTSYRMCWAGSQTEQASRWCAAAAGSPSHTDSSSAWERSRRSETSAASKHNSNQCFQHLHPQRGSEAVQSWKCWRRTLTDRLAEDDVTAILQREAQGDGGGAVLHQEEHQRFLGSVAHQSHAVCQSGEQRIQGLAPFTWWKTTSVVWKYVCFPFSIVHPDVKEPGN